MRRIVLVLLLIITSTLGLSAQSDSVVARYLEDNYNVRFTSGNDFDVLPSGREKFAMMEEDLRQAQHSVHMDYFEIRHDSISQVILGILTERAAAGVEVRLIIDDFGNSKGESTLTRKQVREYEEKGLQIEIYKPMTLPLFHYPFFRDHRKIAVIDGKIGYIGGMNVSDQYVRGRSDVPEWRDMHLRVKGEAVAELQRVFIDTWNRVRPDSLQGEQYYRTTFNEGTASVGVVNRTPSEVSHWPNKSNRIARDAIVAAIDAAERHIQIVNPYFCPPPLVRKALRRAIERGVRVEIMVSYISDIKITPRIVDHSVHRMMKHGAEVYYYQGGFHHSKVMTVDDKVSFVGSVNFDYRSLYTDYECSLMILDAATTQRLQQVFERDKVKRCFRLTPATWKSRFSAGRRFASWLCTILRPVV